MDREKIFDTLVGKVGAILTSTKDNKSKLEMICKLLKNNIPEYNWVGFYLVDPKKDRELILGPYIGAPTRHVRIPFGKGICGQVAESKKAVIISDVSGESNYLSCGPNVKSEIVLPIFKDGELVGELDIDSHEHTTFTEKDERFLTKICEHASQLI
jgi:GAF domain-containing protein